MRSSLHKLAHSILRDYIQDGQCSPGDRLPSVRDLRDKYATSGTSIVHALSLLEEQGLVLKKHGVGCYVSDLAGQRTPAQSAPNMLGYVGPFTTSELALAIYEGLERAARKRGYHVVTVSSSNDYEAERQKIQQLVDAGCDAIVMTPATRTKKQLESDYLRSEYTDISVVLVDIAYPEQRRSQVIFDNFRSGYEMARHLIREGHRGIAFVDVNSRDGDLMHRSTRDRYDGYLAALAEAGLSPRPQDHWTIIHGSSQDPPGAALPFLSRLPEEAMMSELAPFMFEWYKQDDRATAIIALEDTAAALMISLAGELGVQVPDELRIVGFDNTRTGRSSHIPFPTTEPDFVRAGELAAELAIQHAQGSLKEPVTYMLPAPLKQRQAIVSACPQFASDLAEIRSAHSIAAAKSSE